jgi:hypothetical protein
MLYKSNITVTFRGYDGLYNPHINSHFDTAMAMTAARKPSFPLIATVLLPDEVIDDADAFVDEDVDTSCAKPIVLF